jgi:glucose-6-phosphate 1-dehydrogenase
VIHNAGVGSAAERHRTAGGCERIFAVNAGRHRLDPPELPAYGRLLLDVLNGNAALSIRDDEAEQSWRVVSPVLTAWSKDMIPLLEYPAGSDGPGPSAAGK